MNSRSDHDVTPTGKSAGWWTKINRLCGSNKAIRLATVAVFCTGLVFIGDGLYIKAKAQLAQVLLSHAFEKTLAGNGPAKPWPWADIHPIAKIAAPRIRASNLVLADVSGEALAFGPGHIPQTPLPGEDGTSVIAAHRDTHFQWLQHIEKSDIIEITNQSGEKLSFKVTGMRVADADNFGIDISGFSKRLVLSTCYPFDTTEPGPLRYVVEAELNYSDEPKQVSQAMRLTGGSR